MNNNLFFISYYLNNLFPAENINVVYKKIIIVDNRSLGLSRNDGVTASSGEFVCTADADDLISKNWLSESYKAAKRYFDCHQSHCIVVSEYIYSFGNIVSLQKYFNSKYFAPCDVIAYNPFSSRIFAHRSIFVRIPYRNLSKDSGFAYEDWDFNVRAYHQNIEFITADQTILFYRRRDNSIMSQTDYVRLIPYSDLFNPTNLVERHSRYKRPEDFGEIVKYDVKAFSKSAYFLETIREMRAIEPCISIKNHEFCQNTDLIWRHYGYNLFDLFKKTCTHQFDCIIYLSKDVSDRELQGIIFLLNKVGLNLKLGDCLLITEHPTKALQTIFELVPVLDLSSFTKDMTESTRDVFRCRVLLSLLNSGACLVTERGSNAFINHYRKALSSRANLIALTSFLTYPAKQIKQILVTLNKEVWWKSPIMADEDIFFTLPKIVKFFSNFPVLYAMLKRIYRNRFVYKVVQVFFRHELE